MCYKLKLTVLLKLPKNTHNNYLNNVTHNIYTCTVLISYVSCGCFYFAYCSSVLDIPWRLRTLVNDEGKITCEVCGRTYKYKAGYYNHRRYECGKKPSMQCPKCPYRSKTRGALKAHLALRHSCE